MSRKIEGSGIEQPDSVQNRPEIECSFVSTRWTADDHVYKKPGLARPADKSIPIAVPGGLIRFPQFRLETGIKAQNTLDSLEANGVHLLPLRTHELAGSKG